MLLCHFKCQWLTGFRLALGRIAALNMLGRDIEIHSVPFFWTVLFGKSLRYAGGCVYQVGVSTRWACLLGGCVCQVGMSRWACLSCGCV